MCDEIKTFLLAGHETSAAMLIWTTWELAKAPEKMKIATEEAKKVYKNSEKKNKKTPSRDDLNGLRIHRRRVERVFAFVLRSAGGYS